MRAIRLGPVQAWQLLHGGVDVINAAFPVPDDAWPTCRQCSGEAAFDLCHGGAKCECGGSGRGPLRVAIYATGDTDDCWQDPPLVGDPYLTPDAAALAGVLNDGSKASDVVTMSLEAFVAIATITGCHEAGTCDYQVNGSDWDTCGGDEYEGEIFWHWRVSAVEALRPAHIDWIHAARAESETR